MKAEIEIKDKVIEVESIFRKYVKIDGEVLIGLSFFDAFKLFEKHRITKSVKELSVRINDDGMNYFKGEVLD